MVTSPKIHWKRIALAIILPAALIADLRFFQLKHQALVWANGGRWCADVDEVSGDVLELHYGEKNCGGRELELRYAITINSETIALL